MPKGFYTQGTTVLFRHRPTMEEIKRSLAGMQIVKEIEAEHDWQLSGQGPMPLL